MSNSDDFELDEPEEFEDPEFDPWYAKMLDAVGEYMDTIGSRKNREINGRDILIITALIDFYGYDPEEILDVLEDVNIRTKQLELEDTKENVKH